MEAISKNGGLSARRMAINNVRKILFLVTALLHRGKLWTIIAGTMLTLSSCHEKTSGQNSADLKRDKAAAVHDTLKPKVNIKVNRHYDEKGNLTGFDSTYSSYYSRASGDTAKMDSLMHRFDRFFSRNRSSIFDDRFNELFFNDSLRYPDFFHNDFFLKRYELNDAYFRDMMNRMDSIKNRFYFEHPKENNKGKDL
jgi:hypothetical protein